MPFDNLPPLPPGGFQQLATNMGQPQASYAFNPVTEAPPFDESVLGEDVMGMPLDRSLGEMGEMEGMEGMEPMGMGMEMDDDMPPDPRAKEAAMAALQNKAIQRQAATDSFQSNATKLARTMRGPQPL